MNEAVDAVSIVLTCGDEIFAIQRQYFLKAFPGYWAFPGGKVESTDEVFAPDHLLCRAHEKRLLGAVIREAEEELGVDLKSELETGRVERVDYLGLAVTPDFNPYRYATYFFRFHLKEKIQFTVDRNEARLAKWMSAPDLLKNYNKGFILAVPPVIKVIETLGRDPETRSIPDLNFTYDKETSVPVIESVKGIRQIMPLSNTLPPAIRTNAFLIGDTVRILLDPSPKDEGEYRKFKMTLEEFGVDRIMLTHHHPDHHERSTQLAKDFAVPMLMSRDTYDRLVRKDPEYFTGVRTEFLKDGDVVTEWLGREVKVVAIPGHDEGHLALASSDMSWFIAGDLFQGVGTVVIGGDEGDMKKYFETLEKVIRLGPKVVFPSHGIGLGGVSILERTLEHRKLRENQVLQLHREGVSEGEIVAKIYAEVPKKLWPYALENVRKHLEKLRAEGLI